MNTIGKKSAISTTNRFGKKSSFSQIQKKQVAIKKRQIIQLKSDKSVAFANNMCCVSMWILPSPFLFLFYYNPYRYLTWCKSYFFCIVGHIHLPSLFTGGCVEWPPRSPDLTPCDFSLWGIIKNCVYVQKLCDINHLKSLIEEELTSLNNNLESCRAICRSVANRCQICINTEGKQFEHLLWNA